MLSDIELGAYWVNLAKGVGRKLVDVERKSLGDVEGTPSSPHSLLCVCIIRELFTWRHAQALINVDLIKSSHLEEDAHALAKIQLVQVPSRCMQRGLCWIDLSAHLGGIAQGSDLAEEVRGFDRGGGPQLLHVAQLTHQAQPALLCLRAALPQLAVLLLHFLHLHTGGHNVTACARDLLACRPTAHSHFSTAPPIALIDELSHSGCR